ncbi:ArnT family glycosyltransferase [Crateriforma spongiae]|uniref:ArnT family glycosyltransferase n=1 Tax=Crateriforma spongiae TaxID=2724528 RepID=UPI00144562D8|nr:glycosyltransferase family 39 protein [Crateriforma spongiae]
MSKTATRHALVFICGCITALMVFGGHTLMTGQLSGPPPITDDQLAYDSLGWEIANSGIYQTHYASPTFLNAYGGAADAILDLHGSENPRRVGPWPTAMRPPLYPYLLALGNRLLGRQFMFGRLINLAAAALTCGILALLADRFGGWPTAVVAVGQFCLVDVRTRMFARTLLTESLAMLAIAVLFWVLISVMDRRRTRPYRGWIIAGVVLGVSALLRSMFVLWIPVIAIGLWRRKRKSSETGTASGEWIPIAGMVLIATLVLSPWMVRNLTVLDGFQPLGTQGAKDAVAGYSDRSLRGMGLWWDPRAAGLFDDVGTNLGSLETETQWGRTSVALAKNWIVSDGYKLPVLAAAKVFSAWRPWNLGDLYVSAFALLGWIAYRQTEHARVAGILWLACTLGIAATWSTAGRFTVPLLMPIHLFASLGVVHCWRSTLHDPPADV